MLQPGTLILEKYRVERVLGKGGMGIVLAVRHEQLGELFALKTMLPDALDNPESIERFLREARACARLKGEHVARVHDVGNLKDGTPYMLMEYLEGDDLGHVVERSGALPLEEAVLYVVQACEAVAEAHANHIIHRDLKPSNLFLARRPNGSPCVKVLDFGISKEINGGDKASAKLTKTGQFMGSPMYMSPEQMTDVKTADARSDIWSLGVILYELATGRAPFEAEAVTMVVTKVLLSRPESPSTVRPGLPSAFDAVVMRCLDKQPDGRYQSARDLMADLVPLVAPSMFSLERSGSFPRIHVNARLDGTNSGPSAILMPPSTVAETLQGPGVSPVMVGATTEPATSTLAAVSLHQVTEAVQAALPATTLVMGDASVSAVVAAHTQEAGLPLMRILPPGATSVPASASTHPRRWGWVAMGAVLIVAVVFFFVNRSSSETIAHGSMAGTPTEGTIASAAKEAPKPDSTTNTASPATDPPKDVAPIVDPPPNEPSSAKPMTPEPRGTSTTTSSKVTTPGSTSTVKRPPTKKPPVRGYDD